MIKVKKGEVVLDGTGREILADLTIAIKSVYEILKKEANEDCAKESIVLCGKLAFMTDEELENDKRRFGL